MTFRPINYVAISAAALFFLGVSAYAQGTGDTDAIIKSLTPRTGIISIANGIAQIDVGPDFVYLDQKDATTYLTKVLGNPASAVEGNDGMIAPKANGQNWFAVIEYAPAGHVADSDESSINYDDLLNQIKTSADEETKQRRDNKLQGYRVIGWAQKPYYDATNKKLYWAKALQFDGENSETLNYDIRVLGRAGYVNVKIVDSINQLANINAQVPTILSMVNFTKGNSYTDYVEGTDHKAAYGIAGLIAGGILAKAGFFKGLLVLAAAFWKVIAVAVVGFFAAVGNFFRKLLGRKPAQ